LRLPLKGGAVGRRDTRHEGLDGGFHLCHAGLEALASLGAQHVRMPLSDHSDHQTSETLDLLQESPRNGIVEQRR
jgi:hypothetical protein